MRIAIVGAGVTGLTAAYDLSKQNHQVVVFEASDRTGGLASGFRDEGWEWSLERFYHHWFTSDDAIYLSSGTWSLMGVETTEPVITEDSLEYNFTNEGAADGGFRVLKNIMGLWIMQECKHYWDSQGAEDSYDDLTDMATVIGTIKHFVGDGGTVWGTSTNPGFDGSGADPGLWPRCLPGYRPEVCISGCIAVFPVGADNVKARRADVARL